MHPELQGRGVEKGLLGAFLEMVDEQGLPSYLKAVLICLLIRFLEQRSILVELNNRETKIKTAQFNGIVLSEGV